MNAGYRFPVEDPPDLVDIPIAGNLQSEHERYLTEKHIKKPVII